MQSHGNDNTQAGGDITIKNKRPFVLPDRTPVSSQPPNEYIVYLQIIQIILLLCIATMGAINWDRVSKLGYNTSQIQSTVVNNRHDINDINQTIHSNARFFDILQDKLLSN